MDQKSEFPLLKLPYLALKGVLKKMEPLDVIHLSKTSKTCNSRVRGFKRYEYECILSIHENPYLTVSSAGQPNYIPLFLETQKNQSSLKQLVEEMENIRAVLNIKVETLKLDMGFCESESKFFVDWLKQYYPVIGRAELTGNTVSHGDLEYFLKEIRITDSVTLGVETDEKKKVEIPKNLRRFHVANGDWIGLEQFMKMDCAEMRLRNTSLTRRDVQQFLKSWKVSRCHQNLKSLCLTMKTVENSNPKKEIERLMSSLNPNGFLLNTRRNDFEHLLFSNTDGKVASFKTHANRKSVSISFTVLNGTGR